MIQRLNIAVVLVALLAACTSPQLLAQSGAGTIQGTVQDATSAAIPEAKVQALNTATGVAVATSVEGEINTITSGKAAIRKNRRTHCEMVTRRMSAPEEPASKMTMESAPGRLA